MVCDGGWADLQQSGQQWKKFPPDMEPQRTCFFSQAESVSPLIPVTSAVATVARIRFRTYLRGFGRSWPAECTRGEHDESGFEMDLETTLARVPSTLPAPSGCCGLPP